MKRSAFFKSFLAIAVTPSLIKSISAISKKDSISQIELAIAKLKNPNITKGWAIDMEVVNNVCIDDKTLYTIEPDVEEGRMNLYAMSNGHLHKIGSSLKPSTNE